MTDLIIPFAFGFITSTIISFTYYKLKNMSNKNKINDHIKLIKKYDKMSYNKEFIDFLKLDLYKKTGYLWQE